jgi:hypothetical protein
MSTPNYLVTFDFAQFALEYPEFATVNPVRAQSMFNMAQLSLLDNYGGLPIAVPQLAELFNMLVAHLLTLFGREAPVGANNTPVGRMSAATQGTVNVAFEYKIPEGSSLSPWYNTTQYGAMFWIATARFRSARYYAAGNSGIGIARNFNAPPFYVPGGNAPGGQ